MIQLIDISHHQKVTNWNTVPAVPIVHKVNEGTFIDPRVRERLPRMAERPIFGGYTVLLTPRSPKVTSSIRKQLQIYHDVIAPHWRDGAFTQLDVEWWDGRYQVPISADEVAEAAAIHDELFGPGRVCVYMSEGENPNVPFRAYFGGHTDARPMWLANFSRGGPARALELGATLHQYTDKAQCPGFLSGIDANTILRPDVLASLTNTTTTGDDDMNPLAEPRRVYDSRTGGGRPVNPGQTITVPIGARKVFVHVTTAQASGPGHVSVSGTDNFGAASLVNLDPGAANSDGAPIALPDGKLRLRLTGASAHVMVDVYAEG